MKKMMTFLSMIALVIVGTTMIGCSNIEYDIEQPEQPVESENVITLTTTISLPDAETDTDETKALDIDYGNKKLSKTFAAGEQVALIYRTPNETSDKVIYTLTEGDITNGGKTATLTFSVSEPVYSENLTYVYPAVITGGKYKASVDYTRLNSQDGALASIASELDLATFTGPWNGENLPWANLTNELAIIAFTLKDKDGENSLNNIITGMTISDGTNNYAVSRVADAGPIYVAIRPTSSATINYTATDGTYYYTKSVTDKTYAAGQFYQIGLRMTQSSAVGHGLFFSNVGDLVGTDGLAYPATAKNNLPVGVTAAGMVAYKDGKSGLVIALTDEANQMSWGGAIDASGAANHTPVVAGHTWKLPSRDDWNNIINANGNTWTGLNTALESAGGSGVLEDKKYWSSDMTRPSAKYVYWYIKMITGGTTFPWNTETSSDENYVRACFYFGYDPNAFSVSPTTQVTFASGNLTRNGDTWQFLNNSWEYDGNGRGSQYFTWTEVFNDYNYSTVSSIKNEIATSLGSTSWRGLSAEEWRYLMGYDANCNPRVQSSRRAVDWHRYAAVVDYNRHEYGSRYLLLFPDGFKESDWTAAMGTKPTVFEQNGMSSISYSVDNFSAMQAAGIVILPPAGEWYLGRNPWGSVWCQYYQGEDGLYWSSTCADATGAMSFEFFSAAVDMEWSNKSKNCYPVRLVKNK